MYLYSIHICTCDIYLSVNCDSWICFDIKLIYSIYTLFLYILNSMNLLGGITRYKSVPCHLRFNRPFNRHHATTVMDEGLDPYQVSLLKEECIAVNSLDKVIGRISKRDAHLLGPNKELPPLHRAFSVFLFNSKNELLLQQRAACKITFPSE